MTNRTDVRPGDRVRLVHSTDQWTALEPGDLGTVTRIDDLGTVHVQWDSGSTLGLVPGEDQWERVRTGGWSCTGSRDLTDDFPVQVGITAYNTPCVTGPVQSEALARRIAEAAGFRFAWNEDPEHAVFVLYVTAEWWATLEEDSYNSRTAELDGVTYRIEAEMP